MAAFARARGLSPEDADDVAQEVFVRVCDGAFLLRAEQERGRFRALVRRVTCNVIASFRRYQGAARRDPGREIPIDDVDVPADTGLEGEFDRAWAQGLVKRALARLAGDPAVQALALQLEQLSYKEIAARLGRKESDVLNAIHRSKPRVRREIERLVAEYTDPDDVADEIASLLRHL